MQKVLTFKFSDPLSLWAQYDIFIKFTKQTCYLVASPALPEGPLL